MNELFSRFQNSDFGNPSARFEGRAVLWRGPNCNALPAHDQRSPTYPWLVGLLFVSVGLLFVSVGALFVPAVGFTPPPSHYLVFFVFQDSRAVANLPLSAVFASYYCANLH